MKCSHEKSICAILNNHEIVIVCIFSAMIAKFNQIIYEIGEENTCTSICNGLHISINL